MTDLVFLDTETLGIAIDAPIWEFAAIRRRPAAEVEPSMFTDVPADAWIEEELHLFIQHDPDGWIDDPKFPDEFKRDYAARFNPDKARSKQSAARSIASFLGGRPHIVGAVPNFDTVRISHQLFSRCGIVDPWHYHLKDVENVAEGYLQGRARMGDVEAAAFLARGEWTSDELSAAVGVDPAGFNRHTAMGDVKWVRAQWDAVTGGAR
ncbi:3'-5' exonuclease family protein [Mycolicibacterium conceptionense]|uniref:hypothetical protein n=1 Tax=Mycolicibacterium conceptionense TaxID=451644 RepID=UPI00096D0865|nr:hypothetical protein [Mycolicibacterium conceptionense]OMB79236.1 hypothetical protein A5743_14115 [Mycolicibacterium conceptionense]